MAEPSKMDLRAQARVWLIAVIALSSVAITSATFTYAYPETLAMVRRPLILIHDVSGDLTIIALIGYLVVHLKRVWKIKRQRDSRWTGYLAAFLWTVAGGTGLYGQVLSLEAGTTAYTLHLVSAITLIGASSIHGGLGYRRRIRAGSEPRSPKD